MTNLTIFDKWLSLPRSTKIDLVAKQWARPLVRELLNLTINKTLKQQVKKVAPFPLYLTGNSYVLCQAKLS